jgi:biopolymer transport protein TolR
MSLMNQDNDSESLFCDINVTPLVDVMLVLLIIFMVTAPFMTQTIGVNLPKASGQALAANSEPLVISIDKASQISIGNTKLNDAELIKFLKENPRIKDGEALYIEADEEIKHKILVQLMSKAYEAGVSKINIMMQKP